jgi:hypothetical protein
VSTIAVGLLVNDCQRGAGMCPPQEREATGKDRPSHASSEGIGAGRLGGQPTGIIGEIKALFQGGQRLVHARQDKRKATSSRRLLRPRKGPEQFLRMSDMAYR